MAKGTSTDTDADTDDGRDEGQIKSCAFYQRLLDQMQDAYAYMEERRRVYMQLKAYYAGDMYRATNKTRPLFRNFIRQAAVTYKRNIVSKTPSVAVKHEDPDMWAAAADLQAELNGWIDTDRFDRDMELSVLNALFCFGVMKIGRDRPKEDGCEVLDSSSGPFAVPVDLNHFVVDCYASSWSEVDFVGDRVMMDKEWIQDRIADICKKNKLDASSATPVDRLDSQEMSPFRRVSGITEDKNEDTTEALYDYGWVWEVFLPRDQLLVVLQEGFPYPLKETRWKGLRSGPYELLSLCSVPGEVLPSSPLENLLTPIRAINDLTDKMLSQAMAQKTVWVVDKSVDQDFPEKLRRAADGDVVTGPNGVLRNGEEKVRAFNNVGAAPATMNTLIHQVNAFNLDAGNLSLMAGLAPASDTVRQDMMLSGQANAMLEEYRAEATKFASRVLRKVAYYLFVDADNHEILKPSPLGPLRTIFRVEDYDAEDFLRMRFDIVPRSMHDDTVDETMQKILLTMTQFMAPLLPVAQQMGLLPNVATLTDMWSQVTGLAPETLWEYQQPEPQPPGADGAGPGQGADASMPRETTRRYERISRPGVTPQGTDQALIAANAQMAGATEDGI